MKELSWPVRMADADRELVLRCRNAVKEVVPTAEVVLYGSRARGDARVDSDYDLLVLVEGSASLDLEERIRDRLYPIELETAAVITLFLESRERWRTPLYQATPLAQAIQQEGVTL